MKRGNALIGGALVGAANGLFGGGGGMIAVPLLERSMKGRAAHATAIAAVFPACLVSGTVYLLSGFVPFSLLVPVSLGVTAGGYAGARLLPRTKTKFLNLLFALVMFAVGVRMLFP